MKRLKFYTQENDKTLSNYSFITPSTSYFSIEEGFLGDFDIKIQKGGLYLQEIKKSNLILCKKKKLFKELKIYIALLVNLIKYLHTRVNELIIKCNKFLSLNKKELKMFYF